MQTAVVLAPHPASYGAFVCSRFLNMLYSQTRVVGVEVDTYRAQRAESLPSPPHHGGGTGSPPALQEHQPTSLWSGRLRDNRRVLFRRNFVSLSSVFPE